MDDELDRIRGRAIDVDSTDELSDFDVCPLCGQAFDMREPRQFLHHDAEWHERIPITLH